MDHFFGAEVTVDGDRLSLYFEDWLHGDDLLIFISSRGPVSRFVPESETEAPFNIPGELIEYLSRRESALVAFEAEQDEKRKGRQ